MGLSTRFAPATGLVVALAILLCAQGPVAGSQSQAPIEPPQLQPTIHPAVPENVDDYWLAPRPADVAAARNTTALSAAALAYAAGNYPAALASARQAGAAGGPLAPYAQLYVGLSELRLSHAAEADTAFDAVLARKPEGYLGAAAMIGKGEAAELRADNATAADIYEKLASQKSVATEDVLFRAARAGLAAGDRKRAAEAFQRVYYEFPLSDAASGARDALGSLQDFFNRSTQRDLGRALMLFGAKRYGEARSAFQDLQRQVTGDDREVVDLRIAESDYFLKRYAASRDGVQPYLDRASRNADAPNNLGTHYIVTNQDDLAAGTFKELFERFPTGPHAERSAWKYGWWTYTTGKYAETSRVFERAAAAFPRSDFRPPYLYWAARAREKMGERDTAPARMRLLCPDYLNSYYGRPAPRPP